MEQGEQAEEADQEQYLMTHTPPGRGSKGLGFRRRCMDSLAKRLATSPYAQASLLRLG